MRIKRLDLIRYGRFTDARLELPEGQPDIHLVVGPNEAGKSTMMEALGDLLFGIPQRSTQDFRHKYASMRLGALLEADQHRIEVRRRKGFKNTLLGPDDAVIAAGEHALEPYRGSAAASSSNGCSAWTTSACARAVARSLTIATRSDQCCSQPAQRSKTSRAD